VPPVQPRTPPVVCFGELEPPAEEVRIWIAVMQRIP
jgi:hypothetical protein